MVDKIFIGAHESTAGGMAKAVMRAAADECEALQVFVKSPNRWSARPFSTDEVKEFRTAAKQLGASKITAHAAYLINLASPNDDIHSKSIAAAKDELARCEELGIPFYVIHPGSPLDSGFDNGIERIVGGLDQIYEVSFSAMLLLEITCGAGNTIGGRLEHLEMIIDSVKNSDNIGICLDSCHMYAAGYDIVQKYQEIMNDITARFGNKLKVFHLNDSKFGLFSRKDRHELIGKGLIGTEVFSHIVNDQKLSGVLGILETPVTEGYKEEIAALKGFRKAFT